MDALVLEFFVDELQKIASTLRLSKLGGLPRALASGNNLSGNTLSRWLAHSKGRGAGESIQAARRSARLAGRSAREFGAGANSTKIYTSGAQSSSNSAIQDIASGKEYAARSRAHWADIEPLSNAISRQ